MYPLLNKNFIAECKNKGMFQKDIAKEIGCNRKLVIDRAKEFNVIFTKNKVKYPVNEDFFETWNVDMSYILGFIMADGFIRKFDNKNSYELGVEINTKDIEVLNFIREKISPSRPISENTRKNRSGSTSKSSSLRITITKKMFERLCSLGVMPNKSGFETVPNIPVPFLWHFIRGLFDGDGSILERKAGGFDWYICSSSEMLIKQLSNIIPACKTRNQKNIWYVTIRDKKSIRNVRSLLYTDGFFLKRKHEQIIKV